MRRSKVLAKLRANETVRICGLGHYIPPFIRHAAHNGYDCIWLDLEHRVMDDREIQSLLAFFHLFDIDCMLRAPTLEKTKLYRYFEDGVTGLMIPHVSTVEKARLLVQAVKFPPLGDRGIDGGGLDGDFLLHERDGYTDRANRETFLFVQIESPEAVENVEAIVAVEGIDGLIIGPADLGLRLKHAGENAPTIEQATKKVAAACAKHGKAWGQPCGSLEVLKQLHAQGARLLPHGGDFQGILKVLAECSDNLDTACGPRK